MVVAISALVLISLSKAFNFFFETLKICRFVLYVQLGARNLPLCLWIRKSFAQPKGNINLFQNCEWWNKTTPNTTWIPDINKTNHTAKINLLFTCVYRWGKMIVNLLWHLHNSYPALVNPAHEENVAWSGLITFVAFGQCRRRSHQKRQKTVKTKKR